MKKIFLILLIMITSLTVISCGSKNEINLNEEILVKDNSLSYVSGEVAPIADTVITMRDIADFLEGKKEHYPLSDEFIERYQQTSGGYIDNAKKAGLTVDKQQHEPNQKWHFFESWLYPTISEGMSWDETAEHSVYKKDAKDA